MWRHELTVAFRKGFFFEDACEACGVPLDRVEDARRLWDALYLRAWNDLMDAAA